MLLTKELIMRWNPKNKKWFEEKGYKFTYYKDEFLINVKDLSLGSGALVDVKCDCENCKNPYLKPIPWVIYLRYLHDDKYYCRNCSKKLFGNEKHRKTKLKKSKSFEQWCVENDKQIILNQWDYELNDYKPSEINYSTNKKYFFKCPRNIHKSELKRIHDFTDGCEGSLYCKQCNSFAQWGIDNLGDDFLEKYWDHENNVINPFKISHGNGIEKVYIKCQEKDYHGSYDISPLNFSAGYRCGFCGNHKVHLLDSLGTLYPEVLKIWSDKNKKSPYEYSILSGKEVYWKCCDGKHKEYKRKISMSFKYNFRCPECVRERDESFLQEKVRLYLNILGYDILHERNCTIIAQNPKIKNYRGQMPYDNEVVDLKLIVEVHGEQHYIINGWHKRKAKKHNTTPEYELHMQQVRDRYKRIFAKSKNYEYLEIPYWTNNENEDWKKLIDNKMNEIITRKECVHHCQ